MILCTKRSSRSAIILFLVVIGIYVPLNVLLAMNERHSRLQPGTLSPITDNVQYKVAVASSTHVNHAAKSNVQLNVQVKSIFPAKNGTIDMIMTVNIKDLLKNINVGDMNNGEATDNEIPYDPGFVIMNKDFCKNSKGLKYIIYIHTSPGNSERRGNIRSTWGNKHLFKDGRTNIVFIMGIPEENYLKEEVLKENKKHGDIIQADFVDVYKNLTLKGIAGLKWLSLYCTEAEHAIKADDDAFVNIFEIINILNKNSLQYKGSTKIVTCPSWGANSMPILRDPTKCMKWCVKYNEFPGQSFFPEYCAGLSFALTRDLIRDMYEKTRSTPFFWVDDVYITGLLIGKVKDVKRVSLLSNFILQESKAITQYNSTSPITYYMVHIRNLSNFPVMWQLTLSRQDSTTLSHVNEHVYSTMSLLKHLTSK